MALRLLQSWRAAQAPTVLAGSIVLDPIDFVLCAYGILYAAGSYVNAFEQLLLMTVCALLLFTLEPLDQSREKCWPHPRVSD